MTAKKDKDSSKNNKTVATGKKCYLKKKKMH